MGSVFVPHPCSLLPEAEPKSKTRRLWRKETQALPLSDGGIPGSTFQGPQPGGRGETQSLSSGSSV